MPASASIDLNADLGEGCPWDVPLLARVTSASLCCGGYAGDDDTIAASLQEAKARRVAVGAHPGYPDREGFGRRDRDEPDVRGLIVASVGHIKTIAEPQGVEIAFLKPHGALYNRAQRDPDVARAVVEAAKELGLPVLGLPGGAVEAEAALQGVRFVGEGFADRRYSPDGRLVPRDQPGAVLDDPAEIADQVARLVSRGIETICLHGDNPHSVALADLVLSTLRTLGIAPRSFAEPCSES